MIYQACQKGPYKVEGWHDPDSKRLRRVIFRPDTWQAATVYRVPSDDDGDTVMPTVDTGVYYRAIAPGKSGATEPFSGDAVGDEVADGTLGLVWKTEAYNLMPMDVSVASVTFSATNGVTVSSTTYNTTSCQYMIDVIGPAAAARTTKLFQVTCHVKFSNDEESDVTFEFKVAER